MLSIRVFSPARNMTASEPKSLRGIDFANASAAYAGTQNQIIAFLIFWLDYTPMGYHVCGMRSVWHKLFVAFALVWVFAPVQAFAMETGVGTEAIHGANYAFDEFTVKVSAPAAGNATMHQHGRAMADCCDTNMPESCAISGAAHCAPGVSALSLVGHILTQPSTDRLSTPEREAPLAARTFASDPPPPRI